MPNTKKLALCCIWLSFFLIFIPRAAQATDIHELDLYLVPDDIIQKHAGTEQNIQNQTRLDRALGYLGLSSEKEWSVTLNAGKDETRAEREEDIHGESFRDSFRIGIGIRHEF